MDNLLTVISMESYLFWATVVGVYLGLIIYIAIIVATARLAERKGLPYWGFFWLAVLCGIVALIIVCCYPWTKEAMRREARKYMQEHDVGKGNDELVWVCRKCNSVNEATATSCEKCGHIRNV